jgi:D-glycero-D-manno-heptose 1,7-bisphosphate phosphatase
MSGPGLNGRAVFLDRDGVLNEVVWRDGRPASPRHENEFVLAGDITALGALKQAGFHVFIATNQPDVARGLLPAAVLDGLMRQVAAAAAADDVRCCVHDDGDACGCRKPAPGMLVDLARAWRVELRSSYMIGDSGRDIEAGRAAGCRTVLLRRPYNAAESADIEVDSLADAVARILEENGEG